MRFGVLTRIYPPESGAPALPGLLGRVWIADLPRMVGTTV